jgi:hypothetical protein
MLSSVHHVLFRASPHHTEKRAMNGKYEEITHRKAKKKDRRHARIYGEGKEQFTIWYDPSNNLEEEDTFGTMVNAVRLAREMVAMALMQLKAEVQSRLLQDILREHFAFSETLNLELRDESLGTITANFQKIQEGLQNVVISIARRLDPGVHGESPKHARQFFIDRKFLKKSHPQAVARVIVHEASHIWAGTVGMGRKTTEIYEHDKCYDTQNMADALERADSYAWAALSFHLGRAARSEKPKNQGVLT